METWYNLGGVLNKLDKKDESIRAYRNARIINRGGKLRKVM